MIRTRHRELASLARQRGFLLNPARFAAGGGGASWHATFNSAASDNGGNQALTEIRTIIPAAATHAGSKVRTTFRSGAGGFNITAAYIGFQVASGDPYDFAATPTQLLAGGLGAFVVAGATTDITSDDITFAPDGATALVLSFYVASGFPGGKNVESGWSTYYNGFGSAATAAVVDPSGYAPYGQARALISTLEVFY